jgi:hypothetical protein
MAHGAKFWNTNGVTVIDPDMRLGRVALYGSVNIASGSYADINVAGMDNNDFWHVLVLSNGFGTDYTIAKNTNFFRLSYTPQPNSGAPSSATFSYWVINL